LPSSAIPSYAAELGLPVTADEWLTTKAAELDRRLKRFARRLQRDEVEGVEFRDGRLQVSPVKATITPEAHTFADVIETMMPRVRITELLHEVNRATGFVSAFTNLRTGERCDEENALLAAILADATNLGLGRMAAASHGVTRDKLIWTADAYIRPETYKAALARIIDAHHELPIAMIWGDGSTSSSDRQFFRSAKRGDAAGEINARYGHDPGLGFYTHVSDQHGPYSARVMSATSHEAPYVLDGLMHHGTALRIGTHYTDTPAVHPTMSSSSARFWASGSARGCATSPIENLPASTPLPPTKICSRCSGGASGRMSSASTGTKCCAWSRRCRLALSCRPRC
jgi:Tn3 transposase DDE domain-containing protein